MICSDRQFVLHSNGQARLVACPFVIDGRIMLTFVQPTIVLDIATALGERRKVARLEFRRNRFRSWHDSSIA